MESNYADSVSSSPRSRGADTEYPASQRWEDPNSCKVRFMCSFGGKIIPRPSDNQLCYLGGDTRMVTVSRNITYNDLIAKLSKISGGGITIKYQLPNEDLDALISVTTEEDLENMMEEYERSQQASLKPSRLRIFLFPSKLDSTTSSLGSLLDNSKREHWFVDALNGTPILTRGVSESSSVSEMPDYLFGFDGTESYWEKTEERNPNIKMPISSGGIQQGPNTLGKSRTFNPQPEGIVGHPPPDVHSAPDSPMLETSSYGSTSSAPPGANLPPVKVKPVQDEPHGISLENPFPKFDPNSQNPIMEGGDPRYVCEDMGRTLGYRVNQGIVSSPHDQGFGIHSGGEHFFRVTQDMGLRTQDPRVNEDNIAKLRIFQNPEQFEPFPSKDGRLPVLSPSDPVINKPRPSIPENAQRQIPTQEFEQLHISNKQQQQQQQQQERQIRQENNMQDEMVEGRYDWNAKPVNVKSPEMGSEGLSQPTMKKEESNSSLSAMSGVKKDGSQSSQDGELKSANKQGQDEFNSVNMGTGQMKQPDGPKNQDPGLLNAANPSQRDRPNPNLDRRNEDIDSGPDFNYAQKDQNAIMQQTHQDHGYMPVQYEHQYVPSHYVHQGQPMPYYQMHHDSQQGDQPYPIYLYPTHHGSPMLQTMSTVIRPGLGPQPGYNVSMQRNMGVAPANMPAVYSTDVLSSKPVTTTMQPPTAPPLQKQPGYDSITKTAVMAGTPYRDPQFPTQPNMGAAAPRYRAARPMQSDVRIMYRPPQQLNPSPSMHLDQQYSFQHMPVPNQMGYETNPQQQYYTQNSSIVSPPYQGLATVNSDLQSSAEMLSEGKGTRVSRGF